jgi:transmembrane sensor
MTLLSRWLSCRPGNAADWFARTQSDVAREHDDQGLSRWLAESSKNEREYEVVETAWLMSAEFRGDPTIDRLSTRPMTRRPRAHVRYVIAGSVLALILCGVLQFRLTLSQVDKTYATRVGEHRTITMSDGSRMLLNTASMARVHYSVFHRDVDLISGEATFEVAKGRFRPFVVHTSFGASRAIGTRFDVFVRPATNEVSTLEGTVTVHGLQGDQDVVLHAGDEAILGASNVVRVRSMNMGRIMSQQDELLEFSNATVGDAVAEFNHYSAQRVVAESHDVSRRRISGVFHVGDAEGFVKALEATLRLRVRREGEVLVLYADGDNAPPAL